MTEQSPSEPVSSHSPSQPIATRARGLGPILWAFAPHDWLVLVYLVVLNLVLLPRFASPGYTSSALRMGSLLAFFLVVVVPVRAGLWRDGLFAPLGYRVALQGTVQTSYFFFGAFLPLVNPRSLDAALYALDLRLFGFEPCIALQDYVTPLTSEWFAFFYFCYFLILTLHTIPIVLFVEHERLLGEYTLGMLTVFCIGHIFYMLVPGFGPVRALSDQFAVAFPHGLWLDTVMETVKSGGAQKDIFPSLHTAAPTFITLFSFRHRNHIPFRLQLANRGLFHHQHHPCHDVLALALAGGCRSWADARCLRLVARRRRDRP